MSPINLHNFLPRSRANGPGERTVIWVQGCPRKCPGCFNPESQNFAAKELVSVENLESRILAIKGIDGVTFSGGEPFAQAEALAMLAKKIHSLGLTVVCYTGYTVKQLREANREDWNTLLEQIDLLIDGPFIESERCHEPFRGSSNQKFYFLSGKISPEDVAGNPQTAEISLDLSGVITQTGFPDEVKDFEILLAQASGEGGKK